MTDTDYTAFLATKQIKPLACGFEVDPSQIHPLLFGFQKDLVRWSLRKGRAAIFADCGLGKGLIQLEWARRTGQRTLILAPLAVAQQTVSEAKKIDLDVTYARSQAQAGECITVTNYEMLDRFDAEAFGAVVLDEGSILKNFEGKTRTKLIETFRDTPYRLCCTATPAPNDIAELANHAEFLGIMTRVEMLATYFVHDDNGWRLKGHARKAFYKWLASWAMSLRKPSDLAYPDDGFLLPPLDIQPIYIPTDYCPPDQLFFTGLKGITDRTKVRRATLEGRVQKAADLINGEQVPWIAWVGLNEEGERLKRLVPDAVLIEGSQSVETKTELLTRFVRGDVRVMITKCAIGGFGLNLQHCARMVFVGMNDSYEQEYQAIRRCWRFGQKEPVKAYIVLGDIEDSIYQNVLSKEREAQNTAEELIQNVTEFERAEISHGKAETFVYKPSIEMKIPDWLNAYQCQDFSRRP